MTGLIGTTLHYTRETGKSEEQLPLVAYRNVVSVRIHFHTSGKSKSMACGEFPSCRPLSFPLPLRGLHKISSASRTHSLTHTLLENVGAVFPQLFLSWPLGSANSYRFPGTCASLESQTRSGQPTAFIFWSEISVESFWELC